MSVQVMTPFEQLVLLHVCTGDDSIWTVSIITCLYRWWLHLNSWSVHQQVVHWRKLTLYYRRVKKVG